MAFATLTPVAVNAGDLVFCPQVGRAGFVKRSALAGEEIIVVDHGRFLVELYQSADLRFPAVGDKVFLNDLGVAGLTLSARPVGVVAAAPSATEPFSVLLDLNA